MLVGCAFRWTLYLLSIHCGRTSQCCARLIRRIATKRRTRAEAVLAPPSHCGPVVAAFSAGTNCVRGAQHVSKVLLPHFPLVPGPITDVPGSAYPRQWPHRPRPDLREIGWKDFDAYHREAWIACLSNGSSAARTQCRTRRMRTPAWTAVLYPLDTDGMCKWTVEVPDRTPLFKCAMRDP